MKANAAPILSIFESKLRLEVPLFQRQYVWGLEQQWEPLWEDISRKFIEYLEGRKDGPIHFLGAMVLDQTQTPTTHVGKRQVIDGQQRLTTLQIFLAAFRDFCSRHDCTELATECESHLQNKGMMADPAVDRFKVWPTQLDRGQFTDVITARSREALEKLHPLVRPKFARKPLPRPKMVEAYLYFSDQLHEFFIGANGEAPLVGEVPLALRLEESFQGKRPELPMSPRFVRWPDAARSFLRVQWWRAGRHHRVVLTTADSRWRSDRASDQAGAHAPARCRAACGARR